jgi:hypothetical protein
MHMLQPKLVIEQGFCNSFSAKRMCVRHGVRVEVPGPVVARRQCKASQVRARFAQ